MNYWHAEDHMTSTYRCSLELPVILRDQEILVQQRLSDVSVMVALNYELMPLGLFVVARAYVSPTVAVTISVASGNVHCLL